MGKGSKESEEEIPIQPIPMTGQQNQPSVQSYEPQQYRSAVTEPLSSTSKAISESESIARAIKDGTMSGYLGAGTSLSGEVTFKSLWRIDGQFSGRIASESGTIIVGHSGQLDANVEVAIATIAGAVNGDIIATQRLELGRTARVNGNIQTPSLLIEQGAVFEGSCRMLQAIAAVEKQNGETVKEVRERAVVVAPVEPQPVTTEVPVVPEANG
jgi:cytoskeletal protein CcmA (bactofilin family)